MPRAYLSHRQSARTGTHRRVATERNLKKAANCAAFGFVICWVAVVTTGCVVLAFPSGVDAVVDGKIPDTSTCLRLDRKADIVVALLPAGSPPLQYKLLVRMDTVLPAGSSGFESLRMFSSTMLQSGSISCLDTDCSEMMLLQRGGPMSEMEPVEGFFSYVNYNTEDASIVSSIGLDGELLMVANHTYWMTSTHICWDELHPRDRAADLVVDSTSVPFTTTRSTSMDWAPAFETRNESNGCGNDTTVLVFPVLSGLETSWLSLSSRYLYEHDSEALDMRRYVVEAGGECARPLHERALEMYLVDCTLSAHYDCATVASLPFRRVASKKMQVDADQNKTSFYFTDTAALSQIPNLMSYASGLNFAVARLLVLLLTSAVVYIRRGQKASSSLHNMLHAIRVANEEEHPGGRHLYECIIHNGRLVFADEKGWWKAAREVASDGAIGILAWVARLVVLIVVSWSTLRDDNNFRVVLSELVGISVSFFHFFLRYVYIEIDLTAESPLTKLGGPMSVADSAAAVLLTFSPPPLLGPHAGRFDAVARMLVGLLGFVVVLERCFFSASACALMSSTVSTTSDYVETRRGYASVLGLSCALWIVQACCISAILSTLFIRPVGFSLARCSFGSEVGVLSYTLFLGGVSTAMPSCTKIAVSLLSGDADGQEKEE